MRRIQSLGLPWINVFLLVGLCVVLLVVFLVRASDLHAIQDQTQATVARNAQGFCQFLTDRAAAGAIPGDTPAAMARDNALAADAAALLVQLGCPK
jgi:hypothetical protein